MEIVDDAFPTLPCMSVQPIGAALPALAGTAGSALRLFLLIIRLRPLPWRRWRLIVDEVCMNTLAAAEPVADIRTGYVDEVEFSPTPRAREIGRYRYLLLLRFALINITGFALLGAIWMQGWIDRVLAADDTHICKLIFGLFLIGLVWAGQKVAMLSRELNALEGEGIDQPGSRVAAYMDAIVGRDGQSRASLLGALRMKIGHRIAAVRHMASTLVLLGLIGTIVGFIIALSGVNQDAVTDSAAIGPMVATLLHGMAMALFKTLVGSVLNVWLMVNYRLLESGATHLLTHLVEVGERDAAV